MLLELLFLLLVAIDAFSVPSMGTGAVEIFFSGSLFEVTFKPSKSDVVSCVPVLKLRRVVDVDTPPIPALPTPFCGNKVELS